MGSPDGIWHFIHGEVKVLVTHSDSLQPHGWPTRRLCLWNSPGRTLAWVALFFSRGSSWPRDRIPVSCTGRQILYYLSPLGSPSTPYWICYSVLNMRNMLFLNFKINKSQCISLFFFQLFSVHQWARCSFLELCYSECDLKLLPVLNKNNMQKLRSAWKLS